MIRVGTILRCTLEHHPVVVEITDISGDRVTYVITEHESKTGQVEYVEMSSVLHSLELEHFMVDEVAMVKRIIKSYE